MNTRMDRGKYTYWEINRIFIHNLIDPVIRVHAIQNNIDEWKCMILIDDRLPFLENDKIYRTKEAAISSLKTEGREVAVN